MGHRSPRALAAAMSRTVTRRAARPPYSGSGVAVRALVAAVPESPACAVIWKPPCLEAPLRRTRAPRSCHAPGEAGYPVDRVRAERATRTERTGEAHAADQAGARLRPAREGRDRPGDRPWCLERRRRGAERR